MLTFKAYIIISTTENALIPQTSVFCYDICAACTFGSPLSLEHNCCKPVCFIGIINSLPIKYCYLIIPIFAWSIKSSVTSGYNAHYIIPILFELL